MRPLLVALVFGVCEGAAITVTFDAVDDANRTVITDEQIVVNARFAFDNAVARGAAVRPRFVCEPDFVCTVRLNATTVTIPDDGGEIVVPFVVDGMFVGIGRVHVVDEGEWVDGGANVTIAAAFAVRVLRTRTDAQLQFYLQTFSQVGYDDMTTTAL